MNTTQTVPQHEFKGRILPRLLATTMLDETHLGPDHPARGSSTLKSTGHDDNEDE